MDVEADPVPGPVHEQLAVAGGVDHFAAGPVDFCAADPVPTALQAGVLAASTTGATRAQLRDAARPAGAMVRVMSEQ